MMRVMNAAVNPLAVGNASAGNCPYGGMPRQVNHIPLAGSNALPRGSAGLSAVGNQAYADTQAQTPITAFDKPCCPTSPAPCQEQVAWRNSWKGCAPTYFRDAPAQQCEVAPLGDRYWIADTNPLLYERSIAQGAEQNPYNFLGARQALMQFLYKDVVDARDPYTRELRDLDRSYCMQLNTQGPPQYTNF